MTDIVNEFFHRHYPVALRPDEFEPRSGPCGEAMQTCMRPGVERIFPAMRCADGFSMSVQGHAGAYSFPRDDFAAEYLQVEVGYPSAREEALMSYADDADRPTDTVYGYVPIAIVVQVIETHGGLAAEIQEPLP